MKLQPVLIPDWPKLAWVAGTRGGARDVEVLHGPMVEVRPQWCVEAVWAGDLAAGDFDRTDLVFGTGIRCRDDHVVFVTSGHVFDRLWHCRKGEDTYVSNSLPAMLAVSGHSLRDDYADYSRDIRTISRGLGDRVATIPLQSGDATSVYFNSLIYDGLSLSEVRKPDSAPTFRTYEDYYEYLVRSAERIGANLADPRRTAGITPLSSISSGYDSPATSVIARHAGCRDTVTIKQSTSLWRGSDSGAGIAKILGMSCTEYPRTPRKYPHEETFWAAEGRVGILNWAQFEYPEPLCLLFTGCHGEKMWDRVDHDHPDPFVRRDPSSLGFCEFRLWKGVFQCPMPFWGVRHSHELKKITLSEEMRPWHMNRDHDKPIARRIVEQEGVPRRMFGLLNKNTSLESRFRWPFSPVARASFAAYLAERDIQAPSTALLWLMRRADKAYTLFHQNLAGKLPLNWRRELWHNVTAQSLLFQWANDELKRRYERGLAAANPCPVAHPERAQV
jgi:hypothetical protein